MIVSVESDMMPALPFMVGETIPGYCGGTFSLDTCGDELRVEAVGVDWIVLRGNNNSVHFYSGSHAELRQNVYFELRDRAER